MDNNIPKSTEITTDEGSDIQTIYETTSLQSINKIKTQAKLLTLNQNTTPINIIKKSCSLFFHHKYNKINQNFMLEPIINKAKKKQYLTNYKEIMISRKTTNNVKK